MNKTLGLAYRWGAVWLLGGATLCSWGTPAWAQIVSISAPCAEARPNANGEPASYLPSCRIPDQDTEDLEVCHVGSGGNLSNRFKRMGIVAQTRCLLRRELLVQTEAFYRGVIYDPDQSQKEGRIAGLPSQVPVCTPIPHFFNGRTAENGQNHLASTPASLASLLRTTPTVPTPSGASSCGEFARLTEVHPRITINNSGVFGTREHAYQQGLNPLMLDCARTSVEAELNSPTAQVNIHESCQGLAEDIAANGQNLVQESEGIGAHLAIQSPRILRSLVNDLCDESSSSAGRFTDANGADLGIIRQKSMYLCGNRVAYASLFARLLFCEVNERARLMTADKPNMAQITSEISNLVQNGAVPACATCRQSARNLASKYEQALIMMAVPEPFTQIAGAILLGEAEREKAGVISCANPCYQAASEDYFRRLAERWSPASSPACRGTPPATPVRPTPPAIPQEGGTAPASTSPGVRSTQRKESIPPVSASAPWLLTLLLASVRRRKRELNPLFLVALATYLCSCGGYNDKPCYVPLDEALPEGAAASTGGACNSAVEGSACYVIGSGGGSCKCYYGPSDNCCNGQGQPANPLPPECNDQTPFLAPMIGGLRVAGALVRSNRQNTQATYGLGTTAGPVALDTAPGQDPNAVRGAATDAEGSGLEKPKKADAKGAGMEVPQIAARAGGSRSGATGGGAAAGGMASAPPLAMHDLLNAGNDGQQSAATAGESAGVYKGGGAGSAAGQGRSGFGGGSSGSAVGGEGSASVEFSGVSAEGARVDPLGSSDPEDYFTRIGIDNSLFKIVRARYQSTSLRWKNEDSARASDRASSLRGR
jgi:hypothetical protein